MDNDLFKLHLFHWENSSLVEKGNCVWTLLSLYPISHHGWKSLTNCWGQILLFKFLNFRFEHFDRFVWWVSKGRCNLDWLYSHGNYGKIPSLRCTHYLITLSTPLSIQLTFITSDTWQKERDTDRERQTDKADRERNTDR